MFCRAARLLSTFSSDHQILRYPGKVYCIPRQGILCVWRATPVHDSLNLIVKPVRRACARGSKFEKDALRPVCRMASCRASVGRAKCWLAGLTCQTLSGPMPRAKLPPQWSLNGPQRQARLDNESRALLERGDAREAMSVCCKPTNCVYDRV